MILHTRVIALAFALAAYAGAQQQALRQAARLDAEGKCEQAEPLYRQALAQGTPSGALLNNAGNHYLICRQPEKARFYFEALLKINPAHENANLQLARLAVQRRQGKAALQYLAKVKDSGPAVLLLRAEALHLAGRKREAVSALEAAVKLRPADPGALLALGRAYAGVQDYSRAVYVLAQARQRAPKDPEILLALAQAAEDAGFHGDFALAYDEYLALRPADDRARRDRARILALTGARLAEGLKEMEWYIRKHPTDPVGYFNLAQFTWATEPEKTLDGLAQALRLDPGFAPAHFARAWLLQRQGRIPESLPHLLATVRIVPGSVRALDQLGLTYLSLDRPAEAESTFRKALSLDAGSREVLMHLSQALMAQDREQEAQQYLDRFRRIPARQTLDPRTEAGMIELATLPADELARRQIDWLRKHAGENPHLPELQLRLARLLLASGRWGEAEAAFRELLTRNAGSQIWEEAGTSLVRAERYQPAVEFLKRALPDSPSAYLELALATYFTAGPRDAMKVLEAAPEAGREGDFLLLKAHLLDAAGNRQEAERALQAGLRLAVARPQVARQAALMLLDRDRAGEALPLLERAIRAAPANADLVLMRAIVLGLVGRAPEADKALREIQFRWPEWDRPYLAHALLLEGAGRKAEAGRKLRTALSLNPQDSGTSCRATQLRQLLSPPCGGER